MTRALPPATSEEIAGRVTGFYAAARGGDYLVNDPWGTLDLKPFGFERSWDLPFMIRVAGGSPPAESADLRIEEVPARRPANGVRE